MALDMHLESACNRHFTTIFGLKVKINGAILRKMLIDYTKIKVIYFIVLIFV